MSLGIIWMLFLLFSTDFTSGIYFFLFVCLVPLAISAIPFKSQQCLEDDNAKAAFCLELRIAKLFMLSFAYRSTG
jgi:hypothetical protein